MKLFNTTTGIIFAVLLFAACSKETDTNFQPAEPATQTLNGTRGGVENRPKAVLGSIGTSGGAGIADVSVKLLEPQTSHILDFAVSDASGNYNFDPIEQGDYQVQFTHHDYQDKLIAISVSDTLYQIDTLY